MPPTHLTIAGHVAEEGSEAAQLLTFAETSRKASASMLPLSRLGTLAFVAASIDVATRAPGYISPAPTNPRAVTREE